MTARSSALSRASTYNSRRSGLNGFLATLEANIMLVLLVAAVVVAVVAAWIVGSRYEAKALALGWDVVFRNPVLAGVAFLGVLAVTAWITAHCFRMSDMYSRLALLAIFVVIAVLLCVAFWYFYRRDDSTVAFWLVVAATVLGVVHTWLVWRAAALMGVVAMLPAVVLLLYLLWRFYESEHPATAAAARA